MISARQYIDLPKSRSLSEGYVKSVHSNTVTAIIPDAALGDLCSITLRNGSNVTAQIVAFDDERFILAPFSDLTGVCPGAAVRTSTNDLSINIPSEPAGSILDALGQSLTSVDNEERSSVTVPLFKSPLSPLQRSPINQQLVTGIASIDAFLPLGYGQRIGLFAGPGAGKSTLLGAIARSADVDITVIALVGERGREVREFIENILGNAGMKRSVVIATTSDESPMRRRLAPYAATAIAEYMAQQGKRVLLLVDSLTRAARAVREVTLASGEPPIRQGYTNSVYTELPRLIERTGMFERGSITAIYTLLTQEEMDEDALAEEVKSLLDGHLILSKHIAARGIRPAVDLTKSISRLASIVIPKNEWEARSRLLSMLSRLEEQRDMIALGATPEVDIAAMLKFEPLLANFLRSAATNDVRLRLQKLLEQFREQVENVKAD